MKLFSNISTLINKFIEHLIIKLKFYANQVGSNQHTTMTILEAFFIFTSGKLIFDAIIWFDICIWFDLKENLYLRVKLVP